MRKNGGFHAVVSVEADARRAVSLSGVLVQNRQNAGPGGVFFLEELARLVSEDAPLLLCLEVAGDRWALVCILKRRANNFHHHFVAKQIGPDGSPATGKTCWNRGLSKLDLSREVPDYRSQSSHKCRRLQMVHEREARNSHTWRGQTLADHEKGVHAQAHWSVTPQCCKECETWVHRPRGEGRLVASSPLQFAQYYLSPFL